MSALHKHWSKLIKNILQKAIYSFDSIMFCEFVWYKYEIEYFLFGLVLVRRIQALFCLFK